MTRRVTIADIAKAASVGKVTVSYVLNGRAKKAGISKETSERILSIARDMNYRPNAVAKMLAGNRADTIAVVFQQAHYFSTTSAFLNEAMRGVVEQCVELGQDVMLHTKPADDPLAEANALSDGRVDGVLLLRDADDPTLAELAAREFPVVLFFSRALDPSISFVDCDNYIGGKIAANHLVSLGHQRFAILAGSKHSVDSMDRYQGFRAGVEAAGFTVDHILHNTGPESNFEDLRILLSRTDRPTALFFWSDDVAFAAMPVIRDLGLSIPGDISLVGFDSTPACNRVDPPLTSIAQPIADMSRRATQILIETIHGRITTAQQLVFPPQLDLRGSTAPPRP